MSLFKPTYVDPKTGVRRQSSIWWYEFTIAGRRVRESTHSTRRTVAQTAETNRRAGLERALAGLPTEKAEERIRSVQDVVRPYVEHLSLNHRPATVVFSKSATKNVIRLLGPVLLLDLTEDRIRTYIKARLQEGASGRTVNAELGELSRAIGRPWSHLWPRVKKLEERKDVGKALSVDEEQRLLEAADRNRSPNIRIMIRLALLTGMRAGELSQLTWRQIDFERRVVTVGLAKTAAGTGRQIPLNDELFRTLAGHAAWFVERFGESLPEHYVFPFGSPYPSDPTKPTTELKTAWETIRVKAGVKCRWHDLRHTLCTKLAELGVAESTMLSIMGHTSRAMLERYSHIRMAAKRTALDGIRLETRANKSEVPKDSPKDNPSVTIQ